MLRIARVGIAVAITAVSLFAATSAFAAAKPPYTVVLSPSSVTAGSSGNSLRFTFTATTSAQSLVSVVVPAVASGAPWSAPQSSAPSQPGYVSVAKGSCSSAAVQAISGSGPWTVVLNTKCATAKSFTLTYGSRASGATAATKAGSYTFTTKAQAGGSFLALAVQPTVIATPAAAANFDVTGLADATAGTQQTVTVTAEDQYGNVALGYRGTATFSSSDGRAALPDPYTFTAVDAGVHTFTVGVTLKTAGSQSVTASAGSVSGTESATVSPAGANSFGVTGLADAVAGSPQSVTVTVYDQYGNVQTDYSGQVAFSVPGSSNPGGPQLVPATLPQPYTFTTADQGKHLFTGIALTNATDGTLTVSDTNNQALSGSESVTISPAAASTLTVTGLVSTAPGAPQSATVTAYDEYNNVATGYRGTIHLAVSGPSPANPAVHDQSTLPPGGVDYQFQIFDQGQHTFTGFAVPLTGWTSFSLTADGAQTLTATDNSASSITGAQTVTISGNGYPAAVGLDPPPSSIVVPSGLGVGQQMTAFLYDAYGNLATSPIDDYNPTGREWAAVWSYDQNPTLSSCPFGLLDCPGFPSLNPYFVNGVATIDFSFYDPPTTSTTFTVAVTDNGHLVIANTPSGPTPVTASATENYVPAAPPSNATVVADGTNYDLQISIPNTSNVDLIDPSLTVTSAQQQADGSVAITATGTTTTGQPTTVTFSGTVSMNVSISPKLATSTVTPGTPITVTSYVTTAACDGTTASKCSVPATAPAATYTATDPSTGVAQSELMGMFRISDSR